MFGQNSRITRSIVVREIAAPPVVIMRRLDTSNARKRGWNSISWICVGTANNVVTRSAWIVSSVFRAS